MIAYVLLLAVAAERLAEVIWARRNARALMAQGGQESGAGHYPVMILLHTAWLAAMALFLPQPAPIHAGPLAAFVVLQGCRLWVMASLGRFFTTRIITVPGVPLVTGGPYRFLRHPNYLIVVGEVLTLPLVFGEIGVALVFSLMNGILLLWRIRIEDAALAPRR